MVSSKKVLVLGANGMLGRYVVKHLLNNNHFVISYTRKDINAQHTRGLDLANDLYQHRPEVVINCIGLIKQRKNITPLQMTAVNSIFPIKLAEACEFIGIPMIHITTDCVFDGKLGSYDETHKHTAIDTYGKTKSIGEPKNATVIRTSIIGEEPLGQKLSLVEWIKSQSGKNINGFMNHFWNGITCLQLAKIMEEIIEKDLYWKGVRHIFSPISISKFELVNMINDSYKLKLNIKSTNADSFCNRTLKSNHDECTFFEIPDIWEQIKEMKKFNLMGLFL